VAGASPATAESASARRPIAEPRLTARMDGEVALSSRVLAWVGMFRCHRLSPAKELECPHAMGTSRDFSTSGQSHFVTFCCYHRAASAMKNSYPIPVNS
jgi:hypothetical protein